MLGEAVDAEDLIEEAPAPVESPYDRPGRWFVVHTQSGYEKKVKQNLEARTSSMNMEGRIHEVVIPMEDVVEIEGGKKQVVQKKMFPGYLLSRLLELEPEAGSLPEKLDGKQTLKEAASQTRLDEFEAAKVACALLFMGLVARAPAAPAVEDARLAEDPLFNITGPGPTGTTQEELDLLGTARTSIETTPVPTPEPTPEPEPEPEPEPSAPALSIAMAAAAAPDPRDAAPETPFFIPEEEVPPTVSMPPQQTEAPTPESFQMEANPFPTVMPEAEPFHIDAEPVPMAMPEPEEEQAEAEIMPATIMMAPPTIMMPAPAAPRGLEAEASRPAPRKARPSKEDQAALDALLNAPAVPASPASSGRRGSKADSWAPQASRPPVRRSVNGPSPMILGGAVVLLAAAAAGAAWYLWGRTPAPSGSTVATGPAAGSAPAASVPAATVAAQPGAAVTPSPRPTPIPAAAQPNGARTAPATLAEARSLLRSGELDQAAQGFAATVKAAPQGERQRPAPGGLLSGDGAEGAAATVSAELYIVPVNYQGRDCYRLCWGLYERRGRRHRRWASCPSTSAKGRRPAS